MHEDGLLFSVGARAHSLRLARAQERVLAWLRGTHTMLVEFGAHLRRGHPEIL